MADKVGVQAVAGARLATAPRPKRRGKDVPGRSRPRGEAAAEIDQRATDPTGDAGTHALESGVAWAGIL